MNPGHLEIIIIKDGSGFKLDRSYRVTYEKGKELIDKGYAEDVNGSYLPPKKKNEKSNTGPGLTGKIDSVEIDSPILSKEDKNIS